MEDIRAKEGRFKGSLLPIASPVTISPSPHPPTGNSLPSGISVAPMGSLVVSPLVFSSPGTLHSYQPTMSTLPISPSFSLQMLNQGDLYLQQAHMYLTNYVPTVGDDRKRKKEHDSYVRPKVVPERGQFACEAHIRRKPHKCRNASLMEYLGPTRPKFCAEHIDLDPESTYAKCNYVVTPRQRCKEIVLKDFVHCYKHFDVVAAAFSGREGYDHLLKVLERACDVVAQLEKDVSVLKPRNPDLAHRKSKLIAKYSELRNKILTRINALASLGFGHGVTLELEKDLGKPETPPSDVRSS